MATLISIPAGRCQRRGDTKWVDPTPEKGAIEMKLEDDLMHFFFPGEATFERVTQDPSGKTHILKFSSSDHKYFRGSRDQDARSTADINGFLQDPSYTIGSAPIIEHPSTTDVETTATATATPANPISDSERSWPPTPGAPKLSHPVPGPPLNRNTSIPISTIPVTPSPAGPSSASDSTSLTSGQSGGSVPPQRSEIVAGLLVELARQGAIGTIDDDPRFSDILSAANISSALLANPSLSSRLKPLLPPDVEIPSNPTTENLSPVLNASKFTEAIGSFENALRSGIFPGTKLLELGLPENAGASVSAFLEALKALDKGKISEAETDDRMDTD